MTQAARADLFGVGGTELEVEVAEKIVKYVPSAEMALFCGSGSEATYHAIRVSRAIKCRKKIIKFQGCYHGWHDYLAMNVISPPNKIGKYDLLSAGMLQTTIENVLVLPFNDLGAVEGAIKRNKGEIAAVILEPIPHNIGCLLPKQGYLEGLRELTDENDIFLIFDEVITGFRHDLGGCQKLFGVTPDITTLGKAIANGYPLSAICGKKEIMSRFNTAPGGDVFFAGTFNAHPIAMAACLATIKELEDGKVHEHISKLGDSMREGLLKIVQELGLTAYVSGFKSVFVTYFMEPPLNDYRDLLRNDEEMFVRYRKKLMENGIFMLPRNLKRNHFTASHTEDDVKKTLNVARSVLSNLA